jgi:hypothetical protein
VGGKKEMIQALMSDAGEVIVLTDSIEAFAISSGAFLRPVVDGIVPLFMPVLEKRTLSGCLSLTLTFHAGI